MPRLRPINFKSIADGDSKELQKALKDILMLYPRGPDQQQKKEDYTKYRGYRGVDARLSTVEEHHGYDDCQADCFGYTSEQFYTILKAFGCSGTRCPGEWVLKDYLSMTMDFHGAKATRGSRRLSARMGNSWQAALKGGKLGDLVHTVTIRTPVPQRPDHIDQWQYDRYRAFSGTFEIAVPAKNPDDAKMQVQMMFGHAIEDITNCSGWAQGNAAGVMAKNAEARKEVTKQIATLHSIIKSAKEKIDTLAMLDEAVAMYSINAFDAE